MHRCTAIFKWVSTSEFLNFTSKFPPSKRLDVIKADDISFVSSPCKSYLQRKFNRNILVPTYDSDETLYVNNAFCSLSNILCPVHFRFNKHSAAHRCDVRNSNVLWRTRQELTLIQFWFTLVQQNPHFHPKEKIYFERIKGRLSNRTSSRAKNTSILSSWTVRLGWYECMIVSYASKI